MMFIFSLQLIDLRWGIRAESQEDHTTIDFCLREIDNCKRTSIGSSFVVSTVQTGGGGEAVIEVH